MRKTTTKTYTQETARAEAESNPSRDSPTCSQTDTACKRCFKGPEEQLRSHGYPRLQGQKAVPDTGGMMLLTIPNPKPYTLNLKPEALHLKP